MKFNFLTDEFYKKYKDCEQIEKKENRPYACVTVVKYDGKTFAIPIRSNIKHEYAVFTNKEKTKGLDISKAVVIDDSFINKKFTAYISKEEYQYFLGKEKFVLDKLKKYLKAYNKALEKPEISKNANLIKHSALQYFHKELNIELGQKKSIEEVKNQELFQEKYSEEISKKDDPWKKKLENDKIKGLSLGK